MSRQQGIMIRHNSTCESTAMPVHNKRIAVSMTQPGSITISAAKVMFTLAEDATFDPHCLPTHSAANRNVSSAGLSGVDARLPQRLVDSLPTDTDPLSQLDHRFKLLGIASDNVNFVLIGHSYGLHGVSSLSFDGDSLHHKRIVVKVISHHNVRY